MGIELWTAEVVIELQRTYDSLKFAVITPFKDIQKSGMNIIKVSMPT